MSLFQRIRNGGIFIHNYEHEIPLVEDIGMRKFLWSDYFHDSVISDISFENPSKKAAWRSDTVSLTLFCERDCERACQALSEKARPDDWREFLTSGKFTYVLTFSGVKHFEIKTDFGAMEYLNGRFKDSRLVRELNAGSKTPYYHFRIQITWGYIDLVFRRLKIRKTNGRVNYSTKGYCFAGTSSHGTVQESERLQPVFPIGEADDFDCFFTMQKLSADGNPALAAYARECLKSDLPIEDAKPYAAYLLGKLGNKSDLDLVREIFFQTDDELIKRHILDAIEALEALP